MKIALGSDHAGYEAKEKVKKVLEEMGHSVKDYGPPDDGSVDYPDFGVEVSRDVAGGASDRGILVCGTGIGMSMVANKIKGIRAAVCHDEFTVEASRTHNDANVLCLGARTVDADLMERLVKLWIETPFEGGRHARRVQKIMDAENDPSSK